MYAEEEEDKKILPEEKPIPVGNIDDLFENNQDSNIAYASTKKPEEHSENVKIAQKAKINPALVQENKEFAEQRARSNTLVAGMDDLFDKNHRVTAGKTLADQDVLAQSQDHIQELSSLEDWAIAGVDTMRAPVAEFIGFFGEPFRATAELWQYGERKVTEGLLGLGVPKDLVFRDPEKMSDVERAITNLTDIDAHLNRIDSVFKANKAIFAVPEERKNIVNEITGAMGQIGGQVVASLANPAVGMYSLFSMGVNQQADRMEQAGVQTELENLIGGGALTMVSEKLPLEKIMNLMPAGVRGKFVELLGNAFKAGGIEAVSEIAEGFGHDTLEYLTFNKDVEFLSGAIEEAQVAGGAGFAFNLLINALAPKRGKFRMDDFDGEQERLDKLIEIMQNSELKLRNPEILKMHLQNLGEEYDMEENIYMPAEEANQILQELSLDQSQPELQAIYNQLPEALRIGGDVVIPIEDFAKHFTDAEVVEKIRDHVRMSATGLTKAEASEVTVEERQALIDTMKKAVEAKEQKNEADQVMDAIYEQLKDTGQISSRGARLNARMMASYVATKAERSGMSVTEVFEAMNLRIQGEEHQGIIPDSGLLLAQDFGDIEFEETGTASSGKQVTVKRKAQAVWNRAVKKHDQAVKLRDCING
jgi:hypothetical protein